MFLVLGGVLQEVVALALELFSLCSNKCLKGIVDAGGFEALVGILRATVALSDTKSVALTTIRALANLVEVILCHLQDDFSLQLERFSTAEAGAAEVS